MRIASNEMESIQPAAMPPADICPATEPRTVERPWKQTGLDSPGIRCREHLRQLVERERARTDRTGSEFSLVVFGKGGDDKAARMLPPTQLAELVRRRARETDEVGLAANDFVCAVLTGTPGAGAMQFAQGVAAAVGLPTDDVVCGVYSYPSAWVSPDVESLIRQHLQPLVSHDHGRANGHGKLNGNGNGNGNGHSLTGGEARSHLLATDKLHPGENLMPAVLAGVAVGLGPQSPVNGPLQTLFAPPMPLGKRTVDVIGSIILLMSLSLVMVFVAAAVRLTSRGPVIFRQVRAGRAGRPFILYKFRSMSVGAESQQGALRRLSEQDGPAFKIRTDPRVTPVGRFIRKTSLDELPQLWNVLKGDMSLVGPRPLPWLEACACEPWQRRRLDVAPGITCIWQIDGRSRVTFAQWMRMDIAYVRSRSLVRDALLLIKTIPAVLFRRGAS